MEVERRITLLKAAPKHIHNKTQRYKTHLLNQLHILKVDIILQVAQDNPAMDLLTQRWTTHLLLEAT